MLINQVEVEKVEKVQKAKIEIRIVTFFLALVGTKSRSQ